MLKHVFKWILISVNFFVISLPIAGMASAPLCADIFSQDTRIKTAPKVDFYDDRLFIETMQRNESMSQVATFFSEKYDTQMYYTNTAMPNAKGEVPLVDPNSRGVIIIAHGSGTMKSSGRNFVGIMNTAANMGFSAISFDMPHHANGPVSEKFDNAFYYMEWLRSIVLEAKKAGKPVYLVGHSFGPDVILEYISRYPYDVQGALALSPAAFNKVLQDWYDNYTTKMDFGGAVAQNDAGGQWAFKVSQQFNWSKGRLADPTVINPNLVLRILSGDHEEYVPAPVGGPKNTPIAPNTYDIAAPLRQLFHNATVTVEKGIGHYLFDHVDATGMNVVIRELMLTLGLAPKDLKKINEETRLEAMNVPITTVLAKKYSQDENFRAWADQKYGVKTALKAAIQNQDGFAKKILEEYRLAVEARGREIMTKIIATKETHPDFYAKYKDSIDRLNLKRVEPDLFIPYLNFVLVPSPAMP
ncbi:MAG TPA: alpha/beta fold hydrolase [Bdellovibrio sp.]|nr:alpha/beta fold hydrolase [Bdellovibrio sp.]